MTPLKQDPKDFSRNEMRREMARCRSLEPLYRTAMALLPDIPSFLKREPSSGAINPAADARSIALSTMVSSFDFPPPPIAASFQDHQPLLWRIPSLIAVSVSLLIPGPNTGTLLVGVIPEHEFMSRDRNNSKSEITVGGPYFDEMAVFYVPFLL